ncbi:MAG: hypothetical protein Q8O22_06125, partial [Candidatus Omnitrophota bacterium]|nr:hypothetical protein [Candidatus Omnitrophota bacterium]
MRIRDAAVKAVLLIVCLFLTSIPSFAETIILKSGKKIEGKIVERTDKYIKVDSGIGVDVIYFLDEIGKIEGEVAAAPQSPAENKAEKTSVAQYDSEAFLRIKEGKLEEGLSLLKQATILEPKNGLPHMNYGSMLLVRGQMLLKEGKTEEAKSILKEAEKELLSAIQQSGTATVDAITKGQSAFLLGDIYCFIYKDGIKAKEFYKKSLEYFPKHDMAKYALAREEKLQPFFDKRKWIIGDQQENKTTLVREYVLEGETVTNWSELVTVQIHKDMQKAIS